MHKNLIRFIFKSGQMIHMAATDQFIDQVIRNWITKEYEKKGIQVIGATDPTMTGSPWAVSLDAVAMIDSVPAQQFQQQHQAQVQTLDNPGYGSINTSGIR